MGPLLLGACSSQPRKADSAPTAVSESEPKVQIGVTTPPAVTMEGTHPAFRWPLQSPVVIQFYGWRKKRLHEGLDLRASVGTPVFASAAGNVIHAGRMKGYGLMVVVDHGLGWSTIYAHLSKVMAKLGQRVDVGQQLGRSGRTGRVQGPHLHFEIRKGSDPLDPVLLLPGGAERP
ncbi:MAG: M23 family metallopeptidase [Bdellovibrionales bacterium]|nr:M23 family metallopeptidase [Bdellovibrionales bacterium]